LPDHTINNPELDLHYNPPVGTAYPTHLPLTLTCLNAPASASSLREQLAAIHGYEDMIVDVDEYIERKLLSLNKTFQDEEAVQQIVFHLITRARLSVKVMASFAV
jgi:hypothetical protein